MPAAINSIHALGKLIKNLIFSLSFPQVHTLQGEAIQMYRMRQGLLPIAHTRRPQDSTHGRVAAQMSRLQSQLQSAL